MSRLGETDPSLQTTGTAAHYRWKKTKKRWPVEQSGRTSVVLELKEPHPMTRLTHDWRLIFTTMGETPQQQWLSIHDPATCTRKGLCPVTKGGGEDSPAESYSLYFEQHGTGPRKVVFIMGRVRRAISSSILRLKERLLQATGQL